MTPSSLVFSFKMVVLVTICSDCKVLIEPAWVERVCEWSVVWSWTEASRSSVVSREVLRVASKEDKEVSESIARACSVAIAPVRLTLRSAMVVEMVWERREERVD